MKRFTLLFVALVFSIPSTGCDSGIVSTSTGPGIARAEDTRLPKEVREYEARNAKRLAERAAKRVPAKAGRSSNAHL
jgi:hypothetical protein